MIYQNLSNEMIRTFKTNFDYIDFITSMEIVSGEVICSNFVPSAFFPKEVIDYFFDKKEHIEEHKIASNKLWQYGKSVLNNLKNERIQIGIELHSFKTFIEKGIVHEATKNFETSLATRIKVLDTILFHLNHIYFLPEPTPYVFRLIPHETVIIDVDRNKTEQTIQGILVQDKQLYQDFKEEFNRLKKCSINNVNKVKLRKTLLKARTTLKLGVQTKLHL